MAGCDDDDFDWVGAGGGWIELNAGGSARAARLMTVRARYTWACVGDATFRAVICAALFVCLRLPCSSRPIWSRAPG